MINLKEELKEYVDDGSIHWKKLLESIKVIAVQEAKKKGHSKMALGDKDFISKMKDLSDVSFQFMDKGKKTRQRLIIRKPRMSEKEKDLIFVESFSIEPLVPLSYISEGSDETPFWVDNEWYRDSNGNVFRWLGRKSLDKNSEDHKINMMKDVSNQIVVYVNDDTKNKMERVEPVKNGKKVEYVNKKDNLND